MRVCLLSYFDVGFSAGLGDEVFYENVVGGFVPNIRDVGIQNPLGTGVTFLLQQEAPKVLKDWTARAAKRVMSPGMDRLVLGFIADSSEPDLDVFKTNLAKKILDHKVKTVELTIYGLGVVLLYFELAPGIDDRYALGFMKCYEFAAYEAKLSEALATTAKSVMNRSLKPDGDRLRLLMKRPLPETLMDGTEWEESRLFTDGFTRLALCIDPGDNPAQIMKALFPNAALAEFRYEYHGVIYYDWAGCVFAPLLSTAPEDQARTEIARMVESVRIGHTFLGVSKAFEKLVKYNAWCSTDDFLHYRQPKLSASDLNRLRTMSLAAETLTSFDSVAVASEDREFLKRFEADAMIQPRYASIQKQCELLFNVMKDETQSEKAKRTEEDTRQQKLLGRVALAFTCLSLLSALANSYNFVKEDANHIITCQYVRFWIVVALWASVAAIYWIFTALFQHKGVRSR